MLVLIFYSIGMLLLMWIGTIIINRMVIKFLSTKCELNTDTQKEIKRLISSIVTILTGVFSLLYFLLSLLVTHSRLQ